MKLLNCRKDPLASVGHVWPCGMKHSETIAASLVGQSAAGHASLGEGAPGPKSARQGMEQTCPLHRIHQEYRMNQKKYEHLHHNQRYY